MPTPTNKQLSHSDYANSALSGVDCFPLFILANNIEIAGNIGSLFRIAESFAVEKLYLTGSSAVPPKYKIRKAARSADNKIPFEYHASAIDIINQLKHAGCMILSLEITASSQSIRDFKKPDKAQAICLILGAENKGIDQALLDLSDHCIHIPMYGQNSSMNVSNACAIALYELIQVYSND